jgi:hypothetical protein
MFKLSFQEAIYPLYLLLLSELNAIVGFFFTHLPVLTRRVCPLRNGAFIADAPGTLQEQFDAFSTAKPA